MLSVKNLTIETSKKPLIKDLSFFLNKGDKIAVVGEEGNGKSTLLRVIFNRPQVEEYCNVSGEIESGDLEIGYLEQSLDSKWDKFTVYEYLFKESLDLEKDFKETFQILRKLKLPKEILDSKQKVKTLSGGEKVKIQIAKILLTKPDVFLLDEPTNDLDLETLEWLEDFIQNLREPVLYVSHDETLLENTANVILHVEKVKSKNSVRQTLRKVDYKTYVEERQKEFAKKEQISNLEHREYKKDKQIFSKKKSVVRSNQINIKDSFRRRVLNKSMRNILAQEKRIETKRRTERPETEDPIFLSFNPEVAVPEGKVILDLDLDSLEIGGRVLAKSIKLFVSGPEKVGVVGDNGVGKTLLLKEIRKILEKKEGIRVGYMPQNYEEVLDLKMKTLDYFLEGVGNVDESLVSTYLGSIRLNWEEMNGDIAELSYGQRAKIIILKMMLDGKNVLLLDEPTRNLSATSNPVIREILKSFGGTMISISHDRKFLKEVCSRVYKLSEDGIKIFSM